MRLGLDPVKLTPVRAGHTILMHCSKLRDIDCSVKLDHYSGFERVDRKREKRRMSNLITPEELPNWVPGELTSASDGLGWKGIALRGYRYPGQDVFIPPMRDFMIVSYQHGDTPMERRFDGSWTQTTCAPGSASLLTRAQQSNWNWTENIDVSHIYLDQALLTTLASEAMDQNVLDVRLRDVLNVDDPVITSAVDAVRFEADQPALGGGLYVEAIASQLALHLLRHYSSVSFRDPADSSGLSSRQKKAIVDYIESRLDQTIDLESLARAAGLGLWSFNRRFRETFGCAPYAFVIERRIIRARSLIEGSNQPLKQVAAACGFNDQAHMTRLFKARVKTTPGALRRESRR